MVADRLSNNESVAYDDKWIEAAGEEFKAALRKQFTPNDREFGLRMSNVGKPSCQLQHEQMGSEAIRRPYNHIVRMLIGDSVEIITMLLMKMAKINITSSKDKTEIIVNGTRIPGESDLSIDNKVYDIKSSSPWAFQHKWSKGFNEVYHNDTFGYLGQLLGYSRGLKQEPGGWVIIDKSSGEIKVVEYTPTKEQLDVIVNSMKTTEDRITNKKPFMRIFDPEPEMFRGQLTGNTIIPKTCSFCDYRLTPQCWKDAKYHPKAKSKAKEPEMVLYVEWDEKNG